MLLDPFLNEAFHPDLMWFIGVFGVYDREETLGVELEVYDPNNKEDRADLIKNYSLNLSYLTYRHKLVLVEYLAFKLTEDGYDFQDLFNIEEDEARSWPRGEWYELENPRDFLQHVHTLALEVWRDDLLKARLEDRNTW